MLALPDISGPYARSARCGRELQLGVSSRLQPAIQGVGPSCMSLQRFGMQRGPQAARRDVQHRFELGAEDTGRFENRNKRRRTFGASEELTLADAHAGDAVRLALQPACKLDVLG